MTSVLINSPRVSTGVDSIEEEDEGKAPIGAHWLIKDKLFLVNEHEMGMSMCVRTCVGG